MKQFILSLCVICIFSCKENTDKTVHNEIGDTTLQKERIGIMLDSFNIAAAKADYVGYFNFFTPNASFIGTDALENWNKDAFMIWAKPYFDKKATWNFTSLQRNIYFGQSPDIAWFDELLNTHMKICRGSGVVVKQNNTWKVQQYVLSMTVPNEKIAEVLKIKSPIEDSLIKTLVK